MLACQGRECGRVGLRHGSGQVSHAGRGDWAAASPLAMAAPAGV
jgi:hypothetical protein